MICLVQANCENKREGRQLAAQYMLAKLHPHIQRWGGILRLYGPDSKPIKRFDMQEMQNLLLEDRGGVKSNLINLLRKKMLELNEERVRNIPLCISIGLNDRHRFSNRPIRPMQNSKCHLKIFQ